MPFAKDLKPGSIVKSRTGVELKARSMDLIPGKDNELLTKGDGSVGFWILTNGVQTDKFCWVPPYHSFGKGHWARDPTNKWTGWGYSHRKTMDELLACATQIQGMWAKECAKYYRIGYGGATVCCVYKNGVIAFAEKPGGPLTQYPVKFFDRPYRFMMHRIDVSVVNTIGGLEWANLMVAWAGWLRAWVEAVEAK